jgi:TonB-dependent SusC/RagA subfamily outer membrane receptor
MKKSFIIIILALVASFASAQNGVTFVVDENLAPIDEDALDMEDSQLRGSSALYGIFREEGVLEPIWIAKSFSDDERFYTFKGKDVFFQTIVRAYAEHRPLVLSPDMVWLLISQGFARYVNAHSDELRNQIVSHTEKMDLVVETEKDLLHEDADWKKLIAGFAAQINEYTKGDVAKTITADFTTTGVTERIVSQVTLMETVKTYFDYVVHYMGCGIPSITLMGTPQDWQKVLEKTEQLEKYGMGDWFKSLKPILTEFIKASEGKPNQAFWQNMVKKENPDKLVGNKVCDFRKPTVLDGWMLKLFPDENGQTLDQVPHIHEMPSERVYVDFRYQVIDIANGNVIVDTPMELIAGYIGTEVDTLTHALTPKMGWMVRQIESNEKIVESLKKKAEEDSFDGLDLRVNRVPEHLAQLKYIKRLTLNFTDKVALPEWFYGLQIDNLTIKGEMSDEQEAAIKKHFPKADIRRIRKTLIVTNEPLIIVDSVIFKGKLSDIDPATIKSQRVLKDAAATAVYGSQGANGVIEITTKQREVTNAVMPFSMKEIEAFEIEAEGDGVPNENNPRIQVSLSDEEQTLVMSVNDLGFNLFRKVGASESILLSPLGMTYALGLINNGAAGKTRTQINQVLGCDDKKAANINKFCRKMLTETPKLDKLATIDISNEFTSHKNIQPKPAFKEVAKDSYDTKFMASESDQLKFTLVNTINFKGIWTDKFPKAYTQDEMFKGEDGKEQTVPMMNQTHQFFYTENDLCQTLCLPYSNGAYQMIVLLPKEGKTVKEVAQSLTADSWEKMYDQMRRVRVDVKLPRFESESEVNLTGIMSALMPNAFNMKKADFSNLFDLESCIEMIKQKGRIKVDETGTEAWVATALQGRIAGLDFTKPETIVFHATHPFLYFIREWSTSTIFFIGQYMGTTSPTNL